MFTKFFDRKSWRSSASGRRLPPSRLSFHYLWMTATEGDLASRLPPGSKTLDQRNPGLGRLLSGFQSCPSGPFCSSDLPSRGCTESTRFATHRNDLRLFLNLGPTRFLGSRDPRASRRGQLSRSCSLFICFAACGDPAPIPRISVANLSCSFFNNWMTPTKLLIEFPLAEGLYSDYPMASPTTR